MFIDYLNIHFLELLVQVYWFISHRIVFFLWIYTHLSFSLSLFLFFFSLLFLLVCSKVMKLFFFVIFQKAYCFSFNI